MPSLTRWTMLALVGGMASAARGASDEGIAASIEAGRKLLLSRISAQMDRGELALATLAIAKSGAPADDPKFSQCVESLASASGGSSYKPSRPGGIDNYEAAVVLMALAAVDAKKYRSNIETLANYLISKQTPDGAWDYTNGSTGDTSMTQYGILGLWEASSVGIDVPPRVWSKALAWLMSRQDVDGGFTYHPTPPTGSGRTKQADIRHTMSVAGVGSMLICRSRLKLKPGARRIEEKKEDVPTELDLLIPVEEGAAPPSPRDRERRTPDDSRPSLSASDVNGAIELGMRWVHEHFTIEQLLGPQHICYYLYGVERLGTLADAPRIGEVDWYQAGSDYLIQRQTSNGAWIVSYADVIDTSFALLFLSRSTLKSIRRIEVVLLREGTAVGGRGVPTGEELDGDQISRQRNRYQRALRTPIDEILDALQKGEEIFDEGAAAAIETADPKALTARFGKNKKLLCRLARHKQPEVREAALWAITRLDDLRLASVLIEALSDPEPKVYRAANQGLETLSRRIGGVGLPDDPPKAQQLKRGIDAWQKWYSQLLLEPESDVRFDDGL